MFLQEDLCLGTLPGKATGDTASGLVSSGGSNLRWTAIIIIGLLCVAGTAFLTPYSDLLVRGTWMACSHLPMAPLLFLAMLILVFNYYPVGAMLRLYDR